MIWAKHWPPSTAIPNLDDDDVAVEDTEVQVTVFGFGLEDADGGMRRDARKSAGFGW